MEQSPANGHNPQMSSVECGNRAGPPMALVHGILSSNYQWDLNRDALAAKLRLIEIELLGHGASDVPDEPSQMSPVAQAADMERIRVERGIDSWWLCGQSLGGALVLRYALAYPEHVKGVIFTNTRAVFAVPRSRVSDAELAVRTSGPLLPRHTTFHPMNAKRFPENLKARMVTKADAVSSTVLTGVLDNRSDWACIDELGHLDCPVLLVNGRWEKAFQPCIASAVDVVKDLTVVNLEGGHSINVEQPEQFNRAVIDFVDRYDG